MLYSIITRTTNFQNAWVLNRGKAHLGTIPYAFQFLDHIFPRNTREGNCPISVFYMTACLGKSTFDHKKQDLIICKLSYRFNCYWFHPYWSWWRWIHTRCLEIQTMLLVQGLRILINSIGIMLSQINLLYFLFVCFLIPNLKTMPWQWFDIFNPQDFEISFLNLLGATTL